MVVVTLLFNFMVIPKKVYAIEWVGAGFALKEAVIAFMLYMASVGITFVTMEEAIKAYEVTQERNVELALPSFDDLVIYDPGDPGDPNDPNGKYLRDLLKKGGALVGSGLMIFESFVGFFLDEDNLELEMQIGPNEFREKNQTFVIDNNAPKALIKKGESKTLVLDNVGTLTFSIDNEGIISYTIRNKDDSISRTLSSYWSANQKWVTLERYTQDQFRGFYSDLEGMNNKKGTSEMAIIPWDTSSIIPEGELLFHFDVDTNAWLLDRIANPLIPLSEMDKRYLPNINKIPVKNRHKEFKPSGTVEETYNGTYEELVKDIVNNTNTPEDVYGYVVDIDKTYNSSEPNPPYTITQKVDGTIVINTTPTVPYPDVVPNPDPTVDPLPEGTIPNYTPWFMVITNWLSKIFDKMPDKVEPGTEAPGLILPPDNYIKDKIDELTPIINDKIGVPLIAPLTGLFNFECVPIPDQYFGDHKIIDMSKVNETAIVFRDYQRIFWWLIIILMGLNNAYKLIRGTDLITMKGPGGTGNTYKGKK